MEALPFLLPDIWREASRVVGLAESTAAIASILGRYLPIDRVLTRRVDLLRASVETIILDSQGGRRETVRTAYTAQEMERLLAWCRRGEILLRPCAETANFDQALIVPPFLDGEVLAGPLASASDVVGVVLLRTAQRFTPAHQALFCTLLEPFARALENDHHLREMTTLREAAETERRSLLSRLGQQDLDSIIGAEGGLQPVMERMAMVMHSDVPVLLLGETGSGKEVIARAIHAHSSRAGCPFIRVNCGAIPLELVDSELFGHEKGSFTGATAVRRGWFERADAGTLFLDEIGELPPAAQVRLLRVLQDGLFERVGGEQQIKVDVRLIAATHRDLAVMVQNGQFREDLWYRIAVFPILLPPLRERRQDIPALAQHFACQAAQRFGLPAREPLGEDIALLASYDWPGNVRELAAVMDRAVLLGSGKRLEVDKALGVPSPSSHPATLVTPRATSVFLSLNHAMKQHIETALATTQGRIEGPRGAAALLQINPHTLRARMRKLNIDWAEFRQPATSIVSS